MKKLHSLIKACMTSDMSLFKIKTKKNKKTAILVPLIIAGYLMFTIWGAANSLFEKIAPMNIAYVLLSLIVFSISIMTLIEGIYKSGSLIFNCKDDQLLLSLPIKRRTVLFVRIFKFYVFELLFNSMFILPIMIVYIRWDSSITWTYYLTCFVMLLLLPIIPIVLSCIIGVITSSFSSRFKYKNTLQIIISMVFLLAILFVSFNMEQIFEYIFAHASSMNETITKLYYPAGAFATLVTNFNIKDLLIFILVHIGIFALSIYVLGKFYFKINSRLKKVVTSNKKIDVEKIKIKSNSQAKSLIKKEINTFFKTPVFIINAGFALVLFIIFVVVLTVKFDSTLASLTTEENALGLTKEVILNNKSLLILYLIALTAFMTSITNSVISLEGRSINILKSLPIKVKTILMSKVYSALCITTPVLLLGDILLFVKFKTNIIEMILLLMLSILMPLISHFIGIIINLKYPKLNWESTTEVVKQSTSSFLSVMIGVVLLFLTIGIINGVMGKYSSTLILLFGVLIFGIIDIVLYLYLTRKSVKDFNNLIV